MPDIPTRSGPVILGADTIQGMIRLGRADATKGHPGGGIREVAQLTKLQPQPAT